MQNGNSEKKMVEASENANKSKILPNRKSKFWAYFWWLFGGVFGAHHLYLDRDDHALIYLFTLGGYFGAGWLRDLFKIPTYVACANNDRTYLDWFTFQVRTNKRPPFSTVRFLGSSCVSYLFGQLLYSSIPEEEFNGINFRHLIILVPGAIALGTWFVGNVGKEKGSLWIPLVASYICYPTLYYIGDESTWMGLMILASFLSFDSFAKEWRLRPKKKRSLRVRIAILTAAILIYSSLWASYFYFNATIVDNDGEEIKLSDAVKHFLTSPIWMDLKASLEATWQEAKNQGFWATWRQIIELSDPRGEINAYKILGLSQTASQSEVTSRWRALSRENHPDKIKGSDEERRIAQEKFMEIQQAYEILSSAKNRRQRRNRKSEK
ncbi:dnaJ homolog subfamily C member 22 [Leptopilina boulardi]|uniref:dnaJ homolog subfamily C member 22 n=1 Tax=Leptopilina boulardi TaxID=63433 RepID=UPI0021F63760|nr:dnaJ homolog subfamily C member 22 [Leptopilina boulardi]XP_051175461.1 dnaJ homolog subfamily C member 22 [Leptopilina boulardi]